MNISQIFISDNDSKELSPYLEMAVESVKKHTPHSRHTVYFHEELREWIEESYGGGILDAFNKLVPYAFKADLARYLLLYRLGGWYFDISVRALNGVNVGEQIDFITFFDMPFYSKVSYACNNAVMYAKAGSPILEDTIHDVLANIAAENYGKNSLAPTGPLCLGKNVAKHSDRLNVHTGVFMELTPGYPNKNRGFVLDNGTLLALHKPGNVGGDLVKLGVKGTNNYAELYAARAIYDPNIRFSAEQAVFAPNTPEQPSAK
ncbi:glycosyltransferase [Neisseria animalis]|nr:glycosyltransferase [Neisseria animalis]VEE08253.1 Mannosyltransferase OCH1 and related enzymes [Neisseria animalis]